MRFRILKISWKSVRKCEISRKSVPENGSEIENRKSPIEYSKILAVLSSEQIFYTEITCWVPLGPSIIRLSYKVSTEDRVEEGSLQMHGDSSKP